MCIRDRGTEELVASLDSPNEWQRDKAHMLLLWRGDKNALPLLDKLSESQVRRVCALLDRACACAIPTAVGMSRG